jgi:hypothetical protein
LVIGAAAEKPIKQANTALAMKADIARLAANCRSTKQLRVVGHSFVAGLAIAFPLIA